MTPKEQDKIISYKLKGDSCKTLDCKPTEKDKIIEETFEELAKDFNLDKNNCPYCNFFIAKEKSKHLRSHLNLLGEIALNKAIEKALQSQKEKIEGWEKLFEEEQISKEQSQEEVRNLRKQIEELIKQKQEIIKKEGYPASDVIAVLRKEITNETKSKLREDIEKLRNEHINFVDKISKDLTLDKVLKSLEDEK